MLKECEFNYFASKILSDRDDLFCDIYIPYKESSFNNKLLGVGFTNIEKYDNHNIAKMIEMDFFDLFFRFGILGFIIFMIIPIIIIKKCICSIIKNKKVDLFQLTNIFSLGLSIGISFLVGHVISAPAVTIYLVLYSILLIFPQKNKEKGKGVK